MTTLADLTPYHRAKVMDKAKQYRTRHRAEVSQLMRKETLDNCFFILRQEPPIGSQIFDPTRWRGSNWLWYDKLTLESLKMRAK